MNKDKLDGGYKSRKMVLTYITLLLGALGFLATGRWPALATTYPEYCMFLIGAATVYVSGNTFTKWVNAVGNRNSTPKQQSLL